MDSDMPPFNRGRCLLSSGERNDRVALARPSTNPGPKGAPRMSRDVAPRQILFDPTPEIFATDSGGSFQFPLQVTPAGEGAELTQRLVETSQFDEVRFVFSLWHPSAKINIDMDRAYAELRGSFDPEEDHWIKLAEIEPVVPPYGGGDSFDGWIVLPVLAERSSFSLFGSGFEPRSRVQIRSSAYLVA